MIRANTRASLAILIVAAAIACAEKGSTTIDGNDPLAGLKQASATDSSGHFLPPTSGHDTATASPGGPTGNIDTLHSEPGYFRGVVRGSEMIQGTDTLAGSVRVPDVKVDAYARLANGDPGALTASVVTNGQGEWELPVLPAGHYVVTFTPPANSAYQGVWVTASPNSHSHDYPWWVTLPKK
ncbi:MAG TPA: carboxypeptidase-like regulatory domain-containing protein [Gemmatimonadaceae bacterium]|nr:carboxypeptidase-like regulatory domain-containing protein [Gemmatimonadaceae bacterium]